MPRAALKSLLAIVALSIPIGATAARPDPHLDPALLPAGCGTCHRGHGAPGSPMLPASQKQVCLDCHDSPARADAQRRAGRLTPQARPPLLSQVLEESFIHPVDDHAFTRRTRGVTTCTSCHSPHRGRPDWATRSSAPPGRKKASGRNPNRFEYELCESCHGSLGATTRSPEDISRLFNPNSRSYHPVEAPAAESSPSVIPVLAGKEINCTDCHGADNLAGARGPHGSSTRFLLKAAYETADGSEESAQVYELCYGCHERQAVLDSPLFPEHRRHVVDLGASCATCHSGHGSVDNRALIRFGEETFVGGVAPSATTGRLAFESTAPGSGSCQLTCHGFDHGPIGYGTLGLAGREMERAIPIVPESERSTVPRRGSRRRPRDR